MAQSKEKNKSPETDPKEMEMQDERVLELYYTTMCI